MAKIKSKKDIGLKKVVQIEVRSTKGDDLSNSYRSFDAYGKSTTNKNCNGPHVPFVAVDEIDTVSGEGLKAFKEISGMLDSKGSQTALRVGISTRKSTYGLMNAQMENAEEQGRVVRKWTAMEFFERCDDKRSGKKTIDMYMIQDDMIAITEDKYKLVSQEKKKDYVKYKMLEGCATCPVASICLTDAKKQMCTSNMLKPLDEFIKKVLSEGSDWALAQLMNLKPSVEGIIFREFDERLHVLEWNDMWKRLTGKDFPGICTHDIFVNKCLELHLPSYAGVDWGWSSPSTVVYFFVDKRDNIYVVRGDGMTHVSQPAWIHYMKTKYQRMYRCHMYFPDIADGGAVSEMKMAGLPVTDNIDKAIMPGIQVIKRFLRTPGMEVPKFFVAKETCQPLIKEFNQYHFKSDASGEVVDIPEDKNNHWIDALRYPMMSLFGKSAVILSADHMVGETKEVVDRFGSFYHAPTPAEFAKSQGIQFNDDPGNTSTIGKIGTLNELDEAAEDPDEDGGGFIWSFN